MEAVLLNISAGTGPEECAHACALTLQAIADEIRNGGTPEISLRIVETNPSSVKGNIRSCLIALEGNGVQAYIKSWLGAVQWVWKSEYRPNHKRKNWFVQISPYSEPDNKKVFSLSDVRFETAKAGGPGGQYVNKTETAVRAVHIPSGKSVVARTERSQMINKRTAITKLECLLKNEQTMAKKSSRFKLRHEHWEVERGNPVRVYNADNMKLIRIENR